ncbi:male accessory gland serine protease inhibitor-like [Stomoxys calcitrans]|uniref:BPTI/Kunitz inhibitor domain-containing protein n=1 Tax=Stomoxys calcitrans TaxID=35570 RepID=A0A1I8NYL0_STOCA|nr:male accessory gland serine protease inhibitor-like [Stomoxys calcitrans]
MKIFAFVLAIFALISFGAALKDEVCGLPHSKNGNGVMACLAYGKAWSYNAETNECVEFVYGGCFGNDNRFPSQELCEEKCKE